MNELNSKAISIKWKDYVLVKDRVIFFNEEYPNGSIETEIVSNSDSRVMIKAIVTPDIEKPTRKFTWFSQAEWGKWMMWWVALENAETSAVGRALAMMWIWVIDSIASADEMKKADLTEGACVLPDVKKFYKEEKAKLVEKFWDNKPWISEEKYNEIINSDFIDKFEWTEDEMIKKIRVKYSFNKKFEEWFRAAYQVKRG